MIQRLFGTLVLHHDSDPDHLRRVIATVRRRWRLRLALRGLAATGGTALLAFLLSAYSLEQLRFSDGAVTAFQWSSYLIVAAVAFWTLIRPMARRVTDEQVALYLEEHAHELSGEVSSAVEFGTHELDARNSHISPALVQRLVERAVESCAALEDGRRIERPRLTRVSGALGGVMAVGVALMLLRPGFAVHGAPFLLTPWRAEAVSPFTIAVEPGDLELPRGADLQVTALLQNFDAEDVTLVLRRGADGEWQRWPMARDDGRGTWEFLVFNVDVDAEYFVEAGGVRSRPFRVTVRDLPYVDRVDLEYRFPAYTGLAPRLEENTGDIAAVAGTRVRVSVRPTLPVAAGALIVNEQDTVALVAMDGTSLTAELEVTAPGTYRVILRSAGGTDVPASPDYFIDVLEDLEPAVRFTTPGRDMSVTSIDEVFLEVEAEDDFAVESVELVYSVNGGREQIISLYDGAGRRQGVTAGHTLYLEEYGLVPGDFLAYHARVADGNGVAGPQRNATDIFFLEIRPFDQRFRQAESRGEQSGGGGASVGELSARQRQIVSATFKLIRDSLDYDAEELRENLTTLTLAQGRLREEVQALVSRMESRGVMSVDSTFRIIAEALPQAIEAMDQAEARLGERQPQAALSPEQVALQHLQRAESAFREREISQESGGGGGGGQASNADELADLFELELDKLRNQYERVDRGDRQEASQQVDELLEKLEELARRQQQENERMRARAQQQDGGGGGGDAQRQLAEEVEEAARRLERLSREQSRPELEETARELRDAAEAMRRAAAGSSEEGTARGQSALDRLRDARRLLDRSRSEGLTRDIEDALERAQRLTEQQDDVQREVDRLTGDRATDRERIERLVERKNAMAEEAQDLERQLTGLARDAREDQPDAADRLRDVARAMRDGRVADKILYSRGVVQGREPEYAQAFEEQIEQDLDRMEDGIRDALGAVGQSREQRLEESLEDTRDLVQSLESLEDRVRGAADGTDEQQGTQPAPEGQQPGQPGGLPQGGARGQLSPEERRQFQQELGRRRAELSELRDRLSDDGIDVERLEEIAGEIRSLERLDIGDPRGLSLLRESVIAGLKEFEFALRRELSVEDPERYFTGGADDVPPQYRDLVEEYYRSLSRGR
jgi:hypothetical protein